MDAANPITRYGRWIVNHPWLTIIATLILVMAAASGGKNLAFTTDYRVMGLAASMS